MTKPPPGEEIETPVGRNSWTISLIIGLVLLLVITLAYLPRGGNAGEDKLKNLASPTARPVRERPDKLCASSETYDLIKREIFRRAADLRGGDQPAFDKVAQVAVVRMENPVMESREATGALNCSGSLSLDLPPGVAVVGGRRTLMADVDYTVAAAADGSGPVVLLRNAEPIITPLATLAQAQTPREQTPVDASRDGAHSGAATQAVQSRLGAPDQAPAADLANGPSFDCSVPRSRADVAICNDSHLSALDRRLAAQYSQAMAIATPQQRALLRATAGRFYGFRDQCPTNSCLADVYGDRMREVRDIIEDRWQPPR